MQIRKEVIFDMKIASYIRTATKETESIATHKQAIEQYVKVNNHELVMVYEDIGVSGTKMSTRKALLQLLEDSKGLDFDMVVIKGLASLTRNIEDAKEILATLKGNNKITFAIDMNSELSLK